MTQIRSILIPAALTLACAAITAVYAAKPGGGGGTSGGPTAIAFVSMQRSGWFARDIRGTPAEGGRQVNIARVDGPMGVPPRWSADGTRLIYVEGPVRNEVIVSVAPDGSDRRVLLSFPQVDAFNVAEGRPSAVQSAPFGWRGIWTADWSPDGSCVVFDALTGFVEPSGSVWFRHRVYVVRLSDGAIWRVTDGLDPLNHTDDTSVAWSESLNVIGVARVPYADERGNEIWVAAPDGSWSELLIDDDSAGTSVPYYFDWGHGGDAALGTTSIAFGSQGAVWLVAVDLGAVQPVVQIAAITSPGYSLDHPAWSPDDGTLVFTRNDSTKSQIATHSLATGVQKVLIQEDASRRIVLAPDWRRIP